MTLRQSNYIKLIAIITMLIDHIGLILFPELTVLRIIGRTAFPLFAYQLGTGFLYTGNFKKYLFRIFMFGVTVHALYSIAILCFHIDAKLTDFNIFFTLALGLVTIYCYENKKHLSLLAAIVLSIALEYTRINPDYGLYGVWLILAMYMARNNKLYLLIYMLVLNMAYCFLLGGDYIQLYSLIAFVFIARPVELKFNIPGYAFYLFYPLHLAVLYLIKG